MKTLTKYMTYLHFMHLYLYPFTAVDLEKIDKRNNDIEIVNFKDIK